MKMSLLLSKEHRQIKERQRKTIILYRIKRGLSPVRIQLSKETEKKLEEIASLQGISLEEAGERVVELYSQQYVNMLNDAKKATENAKKR